MMEPSFVAGMADEEERVVRRRVGGRQGLHLVEEQRRIQGQRQRGHPVW